LNLKDAKVKPSLQQVLRVAPNQERPEEEKKEEATVVQTNQP